EKPWGIVCSTTLMPSSLASPATWMRIKASRNHSASDLASAVASVSAVVFMAFSWKQMNGLDVNGLSACGRRKRRTEELDGIGAANGRQRLDLFGLGSHGRRQSVTLGAPAHRPQHGFEVAAIGEAEPARAF